MEPILTSHTELVESTPDEESQIHGWRAQQLRGLGVPHILAEAFAESVDWHEVAALVARGCPLKLAFEIAR